MDYKKGLLEIYWKADQPFNYAAIKKAATVAADLTLRSVTLVARGSVATNGTNGVLTVSGTGEKLMLEDPGGKYLPSILASSNPASEFRISGTIREDLKGDAAALVVTTFEVEQKRGKKSLKKAP